MYLWQVHDKVISISLFRSLYNLLHADPWSAIADVLCNSCGKENRFLLYNAYQWTQPLDIQTSKVMAIQGDLSVATVQLTNT